MKIFISYSRVDRTFTERFVQRLRRMFPQDTVWFDDELHGGDKWWEAILDQINESDIFIYLLTNESVTSPYCRAEFAEAQRLQKRIITVQVRDRTKLSDELSDIHYVDMKAGIDDPDALANLARAVNNQSKNLPKRRPKPSNPNHIPRPTSGEEALPVSRPDVETSTLHISVPVKKEMPESRAMIITAVITGVFALLAAFITIAPNLFKNDSPLTTTVTQTTQSRIVQNVTESVTSDPTTTDTTSLTLTETPTLTLTPSNTITANPTEVEMTIVAEMETLFAAGTATSVFIQTETATVWTPIPTINTRATAEARATFIQETTVAETIEAYTNTPTSTFTKTPTATYRKTLTATATRTPTVTHTSTPIPQIIQATPTLDMTSTAERPRVVGNIDGNVRRGDSVIYEQVGSLREGESAVILGISSSGSGWFYIELDTGKRGFIAPTLVTVAGTLNNLQRFDPPATPTPIYTNTLTPMVDSTLLQEQLAQTPVAQNADWEPYSHDFDGVIMVLIPVGCFDMGSNNHDDEKPIHEQCFTEPFWIDQTEATNKQFEDFDGEAANVNTSTGNNRPVEEITWFEARSFCEKRGSRLPTEAEWEYAARGPDNLIYPWGDDWNATNTIWNRDSSQGSADVASKPQDQSWVGAFDMGGNVWEWTSTLYREYPYSKTDGRESSQDTFSNRILRGGTWSTTSPFGIRATYRNWDEPSYGNVRGVRCVRDFNVGE